MVLTFMVHSESIHRALDAVNKNFYSPRSLRIDLLKNCPQVIPTLSHWLYDEWHTYDASLTLEKLITSFNMRLNDDRIPITFVTLRGEEPIGVITLKDRQGAGPEFNDFPETSLWMGSLQVVPEERCQGLGHAMLKFAAGVAKSLNYHELYFYTSNPSNVLWYTNRGAHVLQKRSFRGTMITIMNMIL